jgi:hypothetical protein
MKNPNSVEQLLAAQSEPGQVFGTLDKNLFVKANTIISERKRDSKQYAEKEKRQT